MWRSAATCALFLLLVAGCRARPAEWPVAAAPREGEEPERVVGPEEVLRPMPLEELPALLDDGDPAGLRLALERSRAWYAARPADRRWRCGGREIGPREMARALGEVIVWLDAGLEGATLAAEVVRRFEVLESVGGSDGRMLVTGYFEPVIDGSLRRAPGYEVPLYRPPGGAVRVDLGEFSERFAGERLVGRLAGDRLLPFPTRSEIRESGVYRGRELAWARDPVDAFFLEIQGSGTLRLREGGELRIGYAGSNGRAYRSIGRLLIDEGKIAREKVSMQSIRAYLEGHPEELRRVLDHNESTVFFRRLDGPPLGSLGVPVTPGRSVATDRDLFPPGMLAFLVSEVPAMGPGGETVAAGELRRFVLNQDTGGAIRGPGRVDFFWGRGEAAGEKAGLMKQPGRLFFLVPRGDRGVELRRDEK